MKKTAQLLGLVTCLLVGNAWSAETIAPAKEADIRKLLETTGALKIGTMMTDAVVKQMGESFAATRPDLSASLVDSLSADVGRVFSQGMSSKGGLMDQMVPLYHRQFTHEEIKGLLAFYQSPLGKKVSQTLPSLTQESMRLGQEWGESLAPQIEAAVRARMKKAGIDP
jgi:uncharacterized protein